MLASIISSMRLLTDPPFFGLDLDLDFAFALARGARSVDDAAVAWCAPKSSSYSGGMGISAAFTDS